MKNYIGKKIIGFRFDDYTDDVYWNEIISNHIGKIGEIIFQGETYVNVQFKNKTCYYPISLVEQHLVKENIGYGMESLTETTTGCNSQAFGSQVDSGYKLDIEGKETPYIPHLGEGVLMEVSSVGHLWSQEKVIAMTKDGKYLDADFVRWEYAKPIPQLPKYTHAELVEKLEHDFEEIITFIRINKNI